MHIDTSQSHLPVFPVLYKLFCENKYEYWQAMDPNLLHVEYAKHCEFKML